jgi:hypothetical protein
MTKTRVFVVLLLAAGAVGGGYWMMLPTPPAARTAAWTRREAGGGGVRGVALASRYRGAVYLATPEGVITSDDGGVQWKASNRGLPTTDVRAIAVDPQSPNQIYVGTGDGRIFGSEDAG